ncbi:hypothetical protein G5I_10777 [Acromyrmex echinatior]|uniref:Uncharacterized protein n=1 Tax=Acromyrmex echinatior TaxID=103372 RepID=F4WXT7_ACREC|nr:hypothetical protein G5I_10777 [Acromyrmex echinatior]
MEKEQAIYVWRCYTISRTEEQGNGDNQPPDTGYAIKVSAPFNHGLQLEAIHTCGIGDGGGSGKSSSHQDQVSTTGYCAYRDSYVDKKAECFY